MVPSDPSALLAEGQDPRFHRKRRAAIKILEKHPEADAGGEVTNLLVDLELKTGQIEAAADRARNQLVRGNSHFGLLFRVSEKLVENGHAEEALPLFRELRDPMMEVGEHDKFMKSLSAATERAPRQHRGSRTARRFLPPHQRSFSPDGVRLRSSPISTKQQETTNGSSSCSRNWSTGTATTKGWPRDSKRRGSATANHPSEETSAEAPTPADIVSERAPQTQQETPSAVPSAPEEALDPETRHYVAQALTDVDLFSSYGLTQKAANLLESVLAARAAAYSHAGAASGSFRGRRKRPAHGAIGRDARTDLSRTRRYAPRPSGSRNSARDFRTLPTRQRKNRQKRRFPRHAISLPPKPRRRHGTCIGRRSSRGYGRLIRRRSAIEAFELSLETQTPPQRDAAKRCVNRRDEEVDLSDEWEAMVQEVVEPPPSPIVEASTLPPPAEPVIAALQTVETIDIESAAEPGTPAAPEPAEALSAEPEIYEITRTSRKNSLRPPSHSSSRMLPLRKRPRGLNSPVEGAEFELELAPRDSEAERQGRVYNRRFHQRAGSGSGRNGTSGGTAILRNDAGRSSAVSRSREPPMPRRCRANGRKPEPVGGSIPGISQRIGRAWRRRTRIWRPITTSASPTARWACSTKPSESFKRWRRPCKRESRSATR